MDTGTIAAGQIPALPNDPRDIAAYDGAHVAERFGYSTVGASDANDPTTGGTWNVEPALEDAAHNQQGGNDSKQARETGVNPVMALDAGYWLGAPSVDACANGHGILLARAGAPTDDGRLPNVVLRNTPTLTVWGQIDDGMGVKIESAPPLAYGGILYDSPISGGLSSPGGNTPALPALDAVQVNTYRVPPTPWDEWNYVGGPIDS